MAEDLPPSPKPSKAQGVAKDSTTASQELDDQRPEMEDLPTAKVSQRPTLLSIISSANIHKVDPPPSPKPSPKDIPYRSLTPRSRAVRRKEIFEAAFPSMAHLIEIEKIAAGSIPGESRTRTRQVARKSTGGPSCYTKIFKGTNSVPTPKKNSELKQSSEPSSASTCRKTRYRFKQRPVNTYLKHTAQSYDRYRSVVSRGLAIRGTKADRLH